jgi:hypothetical protein
MRRFKISASVAIWLTIWCGSAAASGHAPIPGEGPLSYFILGFAALVYFGKRAWANRRKCPKMGRFIRKP